MPGRQQEFDGYGSPSKKLPEVSRQAHQRKKPDGQVAGLNHTAWDCKYQVVLIPKL